MIKRDGRWGLTRRVSSSPGHDRADPPHPADQPASTPTCSSVYFRSRLRRGVCASSFQWIERCGVGRRAWCSSLVPSWDRKEIAAAAAAAAVAGAAGAVVVAAGINTRLHHLEVPSFSPARAISPPPPPPHRRSRSYPLQMDNTVISKSYNTHHPIHLPTTSLHF